ncbi:MAG: chromate transporter [Treponema sp.]
MPEISLPELFGIFFYVGLFTIGGGLVTITLMQQTIVARGLISPEQFYNMVAVSESTPGPIGINMATYVGTTLFGVKGALIATFGQVLPSLLSILLIAKFLSKFHNNKIVQSAFVCLRPAATGLILVASVNIFLLTLVNIPQNLQVLAELSSWKTLFNWESVSFYLLSFGLMRKFKLHPIIIIAFGALFGILFL